MPLVIIEFLKGLAAAISSEFFAGSINSPQVKFSLPPPFSLG